MNNANPRGISNADQLARQALIQGVFNGKERHEKGNTTRAVKQRDTDNYASVFLRS
jgi:hypothetical protein